MSQHDLLCADASAMINILGSGVPEAMLRAAANRVVATAQVAEEVKRSPLEGERVPRPLIPLREGGFLEIVELDEESLKIFISLVGAQSPDDLDDGEASTIAFGATNGGVIVLDERKGRRICREKFPRLTVLGSIDIFRIYFEHLGWNVESCGRTLINAISLSRMHIPRGLRKLVGQMVKGEFKEAIHFMRYEVR